MTISSTTNRVVTVGNGVTLAFPFPYTFHAQANLIVLSTVILTGVQTTKALDSDYTISGTPDDLGHYVDGGSVDFVTAPEATERITIYRDPTPTQGLDLADASSFPAESVEAQHDYETMLIQRALDRIARTMQQPEGDAANIGRLPSKVDRASKYAGYDSAGDPIALDAATASGTSVTATGATEARLLADIAADWVNINDYASIQAACDAAGDRVVYFPGGVEYTAPAAIALTSSHDGQTWFGPGATLSKGANGSLITITGTANFKAYGMTFDGKHGTYTGKGVVISGAAAVNTYFDGGCTFTGFTSASMEFGANSGTHAKVYASFLPGAAQTDYRGIHVNGPDTVAQHRRFDVIIESGYIDLDGSNSTVITGIFMRVETDSDTTVTTVCGATWGNGGSAITMSGSNSIILGNRLAGAVTLDADFSGSFVGNIQTAGGLTDSTVAGNALVLHKNNTTVTDVIGKNTLYSYPSGTQRIQVSRTASVPDADITLTVGSSAPVTIFAAAVAADRAVTLSTTGAVAGDRFRVTRTGAGAFNVNVGTGPLKALAADTWCDVEYTGAAWVLTAYGTL